MKRAVFVLFIISPFFLLISPHLAHADAGVALPVGNISEMTEEDLDPDNILMPRAHIDIYENSSTSESAKHYEIESKNKIGVKNTDSNWLDRESKQTKQKPFIVVEGSLRK